MIAQHEQQHDETMLITHQLRRGAAVLRRRRAAAGPADAFRLPAEVLVPGGPFTMGTSSEPWALDNERPAHTVHVPAFYLDTTPVTNAAYQAFIADGGYDDPRWWTAAGGITASGPGSPRRCTGGARAAAGCGRVFGVTEPVAPAEPVLHVSWYEAQAYAPWAGRRLPTEAEWEKAARFDPAAGRSRRYPWGDADPGAQRANLGQRHLRPAPAGSYPAGAAPCGARQLIGDVWEWTASDFLPYPGFVAWPYREYSEVFFGDEYKVLRGGVVRGRPGGLPGHVPQLGLPDPAADLRRLPHRPGRRPRGGGTGPMCRHLAYLGAAGHRCTRSLFGPPSGWPAVVGAPAPAARGLNVDGFGVGWYADGDPVPARYRRAGPIWADPAVRRPGPGHPHRRPAGRGALGHPRDGGRRGRRRPLRQRPLAVQPQRRARRMARRDRRPRREPARRRSAHAGGAVRLRAGPGRWCVRQAEGRSRRPGRPWPR